MGARAQLAEARDAQPNMAAARVEDVFPTPFLDGGSLLGWLTLCQPGAVVATRVGDGHFKEGEAFVKVQRDDGDGVWRPVWTTDDRCGMASLGFLAIGLKLLWPLFSGAESTATADD